MTDLKVLANNIRTDVELCSVQVTQTVELSNILSNLISVTLMMMKYKHIYC